MANNVSLEQESSFHIGVKKAIHVILTRTEVDLALWHQLSCPAKAGHWAERHSEAEFIPRFQSKTCIINALVNAYWDLGGEGETRHPVP